MRAPRSYAVGQSARNVREATEVELAQAQAECTFNPAIDKRSRKLELFREGSLTADAPRHQQLYENAREIEDKHELERLKSTQAPQPISRQSRAVSCGHLVPGHHTDTRRRSARAASRPSPGT